MPYYNKLEETLEAVNIQQIFWKQKYKQKNNHNLISPQKWL